MIPESSQRILEQFEQLDRIIRKIDLSNWKYREILYATRTFATYHTLSEQIARHQLEIHLKQIREITEKSKGVEEARRTIQLLNKPLLPYVSASQFSQINSLIREQVQLQKRLGIFRNQNLIAWTSHLSDQLAAYTKELSNIHLLLVNHAKVLPEIQAIQSVDEAIQRAKLLAEPLQKRADFYREINGLFIESLRPITLTDRNSKIRHPEIEDLDARLDYQFSKGLRTVEIQSEIVLNESQLVRSQALVQFPKRVKEEVLKEYPILTKISDFDPLTWLLDNFKPSVESEGIDSFWESAEKLSRRPEKIAQSLLATCLKAYFPDNTSHLVLREVYKGRGRIDLLIAYITNNGIETCIVELKVITKYNFKVDLGLEQITQYMNTEKTAQGYIVLFNALGCDISNKIIPCKKSDVGTIHTIVVNINPPRPSNL